MAMRIDDFARYREEIHRVFEEKAAAQKKQMKERKKLPHMKKVRYRKK